MPILVGVLLVTLGIFIVGGIGFSLRNNHQEETRYTQLVSEMDALKGLPLTEQNLIGTWQFHGSGTKGDGTFIRIFHVPSDEFTSIWDFNNREEKYQIQGDRFVRRFVGRVFVDYKLVAEDRIVMKGKIMFIDDGLILMDRPVAVDAEWKRVSTDPNFKA